MRSEFIFGAVLVLAVSIFAAEPSRGIRIASASTAGVSDYDPERCHALIIGIDQYQHWNSLRCAAGDARAVANVLKQNYGYGDIRLLLNEQATRKGIMDSLDSLLELGDSDSLFIYFAGHGWMDTRNQAGYWIPADAPRDDKTEYLSNAQIAAEYFRKYKVKHLLVVADACFSGALLRGGEVSRPEDWQLPAGYRKPSRWVLTSGDLAPVPDDAGGGHSPFATRLLQFLQFSDAAAYGIQDLYVYVRKNLIGNPICQPLDTAGHMPGGEYSFFRLDKPLAGVATPTVVKATSGVTMPQGSEAGGGGVSSGPVTWPDLTLGAIAGNNNGGAAILNDTLVAVNETIQGVRVKSISARSVELEFGGETRVVAVGGSTGGTPGNPAPAFKPRVFKPNYEITTKEGVLKGILIDMSSEKVRLETRPGVTKTFARSEVLETRQITGAEPVPNPGSSEGVHVVRSGDSMSRIAKQYGVTVSGLLKANNLTNSDGMKIKVGQRLSIPQATKSDTSSDPSPRAGEDMSIDLGGGVSLDMVWCPPGTFTMGSPESELGRQEDETQHEVQLTRGFWMGKYEVTQEQWERIMGSNPACFKGPRNPVEQVSWEECQEFIKKLNYLTSGSQESSFRLPTEAEWEYACRAGTKTALYTGKELTAASGRCPNVDEIAWYGENSGGTSHPVGQKRANAWGLYDMSGNVWEWCQDWWYGFYPAGPLVDPAGPGSGDQRVFRGGYWEYIATCCRSATRGGNVPDGHWRSLGFRVVRSQTPKGRP